MIDLHSHTTASDGELAPEALLARAAAAGVTVLSVTDHDTVAAISRCQQAGRELGVQLVPGIELSCFINGREVHILGHFVDISTPRLATLEAALRRERDERMAKMVAAMQRLGFPITLAQVEAVAQGGQLGRPHLARVLVEQRYCTSTKDAFDRFLGAGKPAFVDRYKVTGEEAIALVREARGVATVAHPGVSKVERHELAKLKEAGLGGLEVFHTEHQANAREKYLALAQELDLVPTAGSDFHGDQVTPGRALGGVSMSPAELERLRARAAA